MSSRKISFTMRYVLTFGVVLFLANAALGFVILNQSKGAMRALINKDMLDVVQAAARSLDGDVLESLTAEDTDSPVWLEMEKRMLVFQESVDIHFIYAVKEAEDGSFVFTVDPDPVEPGEYGEEVLTTPALVEASTGVPSVDDEPAADRWGNFYSAYCPVFDSAGEVAGIVGIDFDAQWFDDQVQRYSLSIAAMTSISVLLGAVITVMMTNRVRLKFRELDEGLEELSGDVDKLMGEMAAYTGFELSDGKLEDRASSEPQDEMEMLGTKVHAMREEMGLYLEYLRDKAYTDTLTRVGNYAAYHETIQGIEERMEQGSADFTVVAFDINSLKELNDTYGHECGDLYIKSAAHALERGLGAAFVYRVGGDEFVAVVEGAIAEQIDERLAEVDRAIAAFNETREYPPELAVSKGVARYDPGQDHSYKEVFARADHIMYENKREYYRTIGDRRRREPQDGPTASS